MTDCLPIAKRTAGLYDLSNMGFVDPNPNARAVWIAVAFAGEA